ncbi:FAD-dependent oxidoreductase [Candidatus Bathyarchaeota archaeon]|nr:FAD-dependent oxidoreductase [Candidatus Bathyarchaeota archaeon]
MVGAWRTGETDVCRNYGLGGEDGALAIDLVNLQSFSMDEETWQAAVGAGMHLGDMDDKLHAEGKRAVAHGVCPGVGIGGHATIGGLGPSSRMWGTCLDHVVGVEVVTAEGEVVRASEEENADLFWVSPFPSPFHTFGLRLLKMGGKM